MKKKLFIPLALLFSICKLNAQTEDGNNAIKLFVSESWVSVSNMDNKTMTETLEDRLFRKMTQLINQSSIAEIGYSTFLVSPKLDVVSVSLSQAGISKVYLAECDLNISIKRTSVGTSSSGEAIFNSFSKTIMGSGSSKDEAVTNALTSLSAKDKDILEFLAATKTKIDTYYKTHCDDVIKEAQQMLGLKNYEGAIALYFSVPSNAPCYTNAINASQKVYVTYIEDLCTKKLVKLKAYVALAQTQNSGSKNYYDSAMYIMSNLSPSSDKCYIESMKEIEKIEKRLDEEQKKQWEFLKKISTDVTEVNKARYKAMGKINSNYQPGGGSTNVIIAR